jgi:ABC-type uncharacterized transport system permease subunit
MSTSTMILILLPIILLQIGLQVYALYDFWKNRSVNQSSWLWVIVILVTGLLGPLAYFILGRKGGEA